MRKPGTFDLLVPEKIKHAHTSSEPVFVAITHKRRAMLECQHKRTYDPSQAPRHRTRSLHTPNMQPQHIDEAPHNAHILPNKQLSTQTLQGISSFKHTRRLASRPPT